MDKNGGGHTEDRGSTISQAFSSSIHHLPTEMGPSSFYSLPDHCEMPSYEWTEATTILIHKVFVYVGTHVGTPNSTAGARSLGEENI